MKSFSIASLAKIINSSLNGGFSGSLTGISIDSRTIKAGDCFFAIKGDNFDGHNYVTKAFENGASCAIVNKNYACDNLLKDKIILKTDDTLLSLADFAREYRKEQKFKVVAITGSVGKTTTRKITSHVLGKHFNVFQSPANFNNNIGLPITLLGADPEHEVVIAELGSNYPGEIEYLSKIALADIGVVTTVAAAHLQGFKNIDNIIEEKLSIAVGLADDGLLIVNEKLRGACEERNLRFCTFGQSGEADVFAENIEFGDFSSCFKIDGVKIELPLPGPGNVENTLASWSICKALGVSITDFAEAVKTVQAASMRTETVRIGSVTVLADCYNANPASMKNALSILNNMKRTEKGRKVFICGDMGELGSDSENLHRQLGEDISKTDLDAVITVGPLSATAGEILGKNSNIEIKSFKDVNSACNNLEKIIKESDIVLVKGSRSVKLEIAIEKLKQLFS
ncbi:MAG TPA: UDP-N-acetylmuramoyl-tripeptide--D-alanyl-D-alanine ligase [Sedimentisphaerales bacterium]|nr:UDP-N-acetylmuramoyl-tripeptide--D-alanyl-D-alanine ligase [Sedimentisphaerales bacterium]